MYATPIAILIALLCLYIGFQIDPYPLFLLAAGSGAWFMLLGVIGFSSVFGPLLKGEKSTARLIEIFQQDRRQQFLLTLLLAWPLFCLGTLLLPSYAFPLLLLLIGLGSDLLRLFLNYLINYLNPFNIEFTLGKRAMSAIERDQDAELCDCIEALTEVTLKSIQGHTSALSNHAIDVLEKISKKFLSTTKSPLHPLQSPELKQQGVNDSLSYVLIFLLQHLESIYKAALDKKLDLVATHVITTLTKLASYSAQTDLSLAALPLHFVNQCTLNGMQKGLSDIGIKAILGLLEFAKSIPRQKDIAYQEIKTPMTILISTLDAITKESFKLNKEIKIQLLIEPFQKLKQILNEEPLRNHQDTPLLEQQVNRIIEEFRALETIMATMPALPKITEDEA